MFKGVTLVGVVVCELCVFDIICRHARTSMYTSCRLQSVVFSLSKEYQDCIEKKKNKKKTMKT